MSRTARCRWAVTLYALRLLWRANQDAVRCAGAGRGGWLARQGGWCAEGHCLEACLRRGACSHGVGAPAVCDAWPLPRKPLCPSLCRLRVYYLLNRPPGAESHTVLVTDIPGAGRVPLRA